MAEYIEREETIKHIQKTYCAGCNSYNGVRCRACGIGDAIDIIEDAPAADVAPVVHARWIYEKETLATSSGYCCSACRRPRGISPDVPEAFKYCPKCGAKMDGERKDGGDG